MEQLLRELAENGIAVQPDEPMRRHTTFLVGGPADLFITPAGPAELAKALSLCRKAEVPYIVIGNGSNLLVSDSGVRGAVIRTGHAMSIVETEGCVVRAQAGASLSLIAAKAKAAGLAGFEFASGIPGSLGGAIVMNAGAYGGEMAQVVSSVTVLTADGTFKEIPAADMDFGYRKSCVPENGYTVISASLRLTPGDSRHIGERMDELAAARRSKQPLEYPSAGSTFKRPAGNFAGKLIMETGLAGFSVGGACVSPKHCGFVINTGGASAQDIYTLCMEVRRAVFERTGIMLELEVRTLGEFD